MWPEDQVLDFKMLFVNGSGETVWEADPTQSFVVSPTTTVIGDCRNPHFYTGFYLRRATRYLCR